MFCHADSLAVRISCNFLFAASRLARIALSCSSYFARASALIWALFALSLSTSASHFLICDSIIVKYSSFLLMVRLLCQGGRHADRKVEELTTAVSITLGRNLPNMRHARKRGSGKPPMDA